ncbi:MAG: triphosphoribosyl-dephospho-CoA synthase [Christensenellales bacterium]
MTNPLLQARELRWQLRQALAASGSALMSVTLRAPAWLRNEPAYGQAFEALCQGLERSIHLPRLVLATRDADGPARHYLVDDPDEVKALAIRYEDEAPGGALLDIDIMRAGGAVISRADLGRTPRACAVCGGRPAALCITGLRHPEAETRLAFQALLAAALPALGEARRIGGLALRALLYEVSVTPKPGLVDRLDAGAHVDMDYYSFLDSALALSGYFEACAACGLENPQAPEDLLPLLRPLGREAEGAMARATGGANTHKGLIFSLGILCAAAGRLRGKGSAAEICALAARIAAPALADGTGGQLSHGERVRLRHGDLGVRGEAAAGFPAALHLALPALQAALAAGEGPDRAGVLALLHLMASLRDTNVLHRAGEEGLSAMHQGARLLLRDGVPPEALQTWCLKMKDLRISPGGCADLLCIAFFLYFVSPGLAPGLPG